MYISHGKPTPRKDVSFPGATPVRVKRAIESLRALWRKKPTSKRLDHRVYNAIQSAYTQLERGLYERADTTVYDAVVLLTAR